MLFTPNARIAALANQFPSLDDEDLAMPFNRYRRKFQEKNSPLNRFERLEDRKLLAIQSPFSYMWSGSPSSTEPVSSPLYAHQESIDEATTLRLSEGRYRVRFAGLNPSSTDGGNVQITAYGSNADYCKTTGWGAGSGELEIGVSCFDNEGIPTDSRFNAAFISQRNSEDISYAWIHNPSASSYELGDSNYSHSTFGEGIRFDRNDVGEYSVTFNNTRGPRQQGGSVMVTAYGPSSDRCQIRDWDSDADEFSARVRCVDAEGASSDSRFSIAVIPAYNDTQNMAYARLHRAAFDEPFPDPTYSTNASDQSMRKVRRSVGQYEVEFQGLNRHLGMGGHIQVSALGTSNSNCKVSNWSTSSEDMTAIVSCFDTRGTPMDGAFSIWAVPPSLPYEDHFEPNDSLSTATPLAGDISHHQLTIHESGDEDFFRWMNRGEAGHVEVQVVFNRSESDLGFSVTIDGVEMFSERDSDRERISFHSEPGEIHDIRVFANAESVSNRYAISIDGPNFARPTMDAPFSYLKLINTPVFGDPIRPSQYDNQAGGEVSLQRDGIGEYLVTFENLSSHLGGSSQFQVTSHAPRSVCNATRHLIGPDARVSVHCFGLDGRPVDTKFSIAAIGPGSGIAYALANRVRDDPYVPAERLAHNPSGGEIIIDHEFGGRSTVRFVGLGSVGDGGHVQLTGFTNSKRVCAVENWQSDGEDLIVSVSCDRIDGEIGLGSLFHIAVIPPGTFASNLGFAWTNNSSFNEWPVDSTYSHNPAGGSIVKSRTSAGRYRVEFDDMNQAFQPGGAVFVTPYGAPNRTCNWTDYPNLADDFTASVHCYDLDGNLADANFTVLAVPAPREQATGDLVADGELDARDLNAFCAALHDFPSDLLDLNGDGTTDHEDWRRFLLDEMGVPFGDANLDGVFNSSDLILVFSSGEYQDSRSGNSTWSEGDWNCDGEFDSTDLIWAFQGGAYESAADQVFAAMRSARRAPIPTEDPESESILH